MARLLVCLALLIASPTRPVAAQEQPSPFGGEPEDVTVGPSDLVDGWIVGEQHRDPADVWTTGGLQVMLRHTDGRIVRTTTWIVRTREQALDAWQAARGEPLDTCEASVYTEIGDGRILGSCLVENVIFELNGAPYEDTRAVLTAAAERVNEAVKVSQQ
jgi:hypothetical protein